MTSHSHLSSNILVASLVGLAFGSLAGFFVATRLPTTPAHGAPTAIDQRTAGGIAKCGVNSPTLGYIGTLAPSSSLSAVTQAGFRATELSAVGPNGDAGLVLLAPLPSVSGIGLTPPDLLPPSSGLSTSRRISAQAAESSVLSCHYLLADKPAATAYVSSAEASLESAKLVTSSELSDVIALYLSDDPLNPNDYIVTIDIKGPSEAAAGVPASAVVYSTRSFAVLVTKSGGTVMAQGLSPWSS